MAFSAAFELFRGQSSQVPFHEHVAGKHSIFNQTPVRPNQAKSCYYLNHNARHSITQLPYRFTSDSPSKHPSGRAERRDAPIFWDSQALVPPGEQLPRQALF
jgi:hypothetical protein